MSPVDHHLLALVCFFLGAAEDSAIGEFPSVEWTPLKRRAYGGLTRSRSRSDAA